jgi:hypothetical protein
MMRSSGHIKAWIQRLLVTTTSVVAIASFGCAETPVPPEATGGKASAWEMFTANDYTGAESEFRQVLSEKSDDGEALVGRGWSLLYLRNLQGAISVFSDVRVTDSTWYVDALAGRSIAYDAVGNSAYSASTVAGALGLDSAYVFFHDPSVDWRDLEYVRAKNYLLLSSAELDEQVRNAVSSLNRLTRDADAGVADIDLDDPSSWSSGAVAYKTPTEAMLRRLGAIQQ